MCGYIRLELGENNIVPVVGDVKISDRAGAGGATASVTIKLKKDQALPAENTIAFLSKINPNGSRTKLFGGRMPRTEEVFQISGNKYSITFNNFTDLLEREIIDSYSETTTLKGHVERAAIAANAVPSGTTIKTLNIGVSPFDDDDEFFFEKNDLNFRAFLDEVVKQKNASWTLRDTGAPNISGMTAIANLIVRDNTTIKTTAPIEILDADETDPCKIIWLANSLKQERIPPQYSVIQVVGRNGAKRPANGNLTRNDYQSFAAEAGKNNYPLLNLGDQLLQIRITKPDMTTYNLTLTDYNEYVAIHGEPSDTNAVPVPGDRLALIRTDSNPPLFYCDPTVDVPEGSLIEEFYVTKYIFYELVNIAAQNIIKQADRNASTGRKVYKITDESITDINVAQQRAAAAEPGLCSTNYKVSFPTIVEGFQALDQFVYRRASRGILAVMNVTGVEHTYKPGGRYLAQVETATTIFDNPQTALIRRFRKIDSVGIAKPRALTF